MELLAQMDFPPCLAKPQRPLAAVGVALALMGLVIAVAVPALLKARARPANDLPHVLAESAHEIRDRLAHKELEVQSEWRFSWKAVLAVSGSMVGFLGAALGTASCARREKWRLSGIAIAFGLTAIAWNYFVMAAIASVALFLMAWVISHFHR
jgi:hypothetical protein